LLDSASTTEAEATDMSAYKQEECRIELVRVAAISRSIHVFSMTETEGGVVSSGDSSETESIVICESGWKGSGA
jgi:hypothetical protein